MKKVLVIFLAVVPTLVFGQAVRNLNGVATNLTLYGTTATTTNNVNTDNVINLNLPGRPNGYLYLLGESVISTNNGGGLTNLTGVSGSGVTNNQYLPGVPVANGASFTNIAASNIVSGGGLTIGGSITATNGAEFGGQALASTNVFQVDTVAGNALNVNTNRGVTVKGGLAVGTSTVGAAGTLKTSGNVTFDGTLVVADAWSVTLSDVVGFNDGKLGWTASGGSTGSSTPDTYFTRLISGTIRVNTNLTAIGTITATNGVASYRSNLLAAATISVGSSPFSWTNTLTVGAVVYVDGISVTGTVGINGGVVFNSIGQDTVLLGPNEYTTITYTLGTPTATWRPR